MLRTNKLLIITILTITTLTQQSFALGFKIDITHEDNSSITKDIKRESRDIPEFAYSGPSQNALPLDEFRQEFNYNKLKRQLAEIEDAIESPEFTTAIPKNKLRSYSRDTADILRLINKTQDKIEEFESDSNKRNKILYDTEIETMRTQINRLSSNISKYKDLKTVEGTYNYINSNTWKRAEGLTNQLPHPYKFSKIGGWIPMKTYTRFTSQYGYRENPFGIINKKEYHSGVDIAAPKGTPIYALDDGIITTAKYNISLGNYVETKMAKDNTISIIYGHMTKFVVKKGQIVRKGDLVGYVGSTGRSTGPHLHIGAKQDGELIDPNPFIS